MKTVTDNSKLKDSPTSISRRAPRKAALPKAIQPAANDAVENSTPTADPGNPLTDLLAYQVDFWQRSVLFLDALRERGDDMLDHQRQNMPPLLIFDYELLLDARRFEDPANYALLKVTGAEGIRYERAVAPTAALPV